MKKNNLIKLSALAFFAIVGLAGVNLTNKEVTKKPPCNKCCIKECKPEPKGGNTEYIFYESLSGHSIAVNNSH